jgi:hypothetical protein
VPLYHCSPVVLAPGSVIQPGNWGRIIRIERINNQGGFGTHLLREAVSELVRLREFGDRVSRLMAAFAFEELPHAQEFGGMSASAIYEVALADGDAPLERYNFELVRMPVPGAHAIAGLEEIARDYWRSSSTKMVKPELLTLSSLQILKRLS